MQCRLYYRLPLDQQILVFLQDIDLFCRKHTNITRFALQDWEVIYVNTLPVPAILLISIPEEILIMALGLFLFGLRPEGRFLCFLPQGLMMFVFILLVQRYDIKLLSLPHSDIAGSGKWWKS